jgi:hypothetical protein
MIRTAILVAMVVAAGCAGETAADDDPTVMSGALGIWDISSTDCPGGSPVSLQLEANGACTLAFADGGIQLQWVETDYGISILVDGQAHAGHELGGAFLLPGDEHADVDTMYGDLPIGDCTAGLMLFRRP